MTRAEAEAVLVALDTPPSSVWVMPIRTTSEALRSPGNWRKHTAMRKSQRAAATMSAHCHGFRSKLKPSVVELQRIAPSAGLDDDNLRAALKSCRDGIADAFGCDDSKRSGIVWLYDQRRGSKGEYAVRVRVWV